MAHDWMAVSAKPGTKFWSESDDEKGFVLWECQRCKVQYKIFNGEEEDGPDKEWKFLYKELSDKYLSCDEAMVGRMLAE